jgi:hypothetical protein
MKTTNFLANIFNWLGEVFEVFNPAAFRFLAATLPYITPVPVAALTQSSATQFLGFSPTVSMLFVFGLEGIGLWFTTMLVDAVVEAIRSKNKGGWLVVGLFVFTVGAYITILVDLNVTLEESIGSRSATFGHVVTLLCFLPLITGIGNGYYKLTLKRNTEIEAARQKEAETAEKIRQENNDLKLKKAALKAGFNPFALQPTVTVNQDVAQVRDTKVKHASDYREKAIQFILDYHQKNGRYPTPRIVTERFGLDHSKNKGYMSTLIKAVANGVRQ